MKYTFIYYLVKMMFAQQAPSLFFLLQDSATILMDGKTKYDSWPRMLTW